MKTNRSFRAFFIEPFLQIRFGVQVIAVSLIFTVAIAYQIYNGTVAQYEQIAKLYEVAEENKQSLTMNNVTMQHFYIMGAILFLFIVTMLLIVVKRTHRMYGPMVSIKRFILELKDGKYSAVLKIREKDDFQDLAQDLNELAKLLKEKHK